LTDALDSTTVFRKSFLTGEIGLAFATALPIRKVQPLYRFHQYPHLLRLAVMAAREWYACYRIVGKESPPQWKGEYRERAE
jgi:hypothetical protein